MAVHTAVNGSVQEYRTQESVQNFYGQLSKILSKVTNYCLHKYITIAVVTTLTNTLCNASLSFCPTWTLMCGCNRW
jgi:hypothetical protein